MLKISELKIYFCNNSEIYSVISELSPFFFNNSEIFFFSEYNVENLRVKNLFWY